MVIPKDFNKPNFLINEPILNQTFEQMFNYSEEVIDNLCS